MQDENNIEVADELVSETDSNEALSFAVIATNIAWGKEAQTKTKFVRKDKTIDCPDQFVLDLPKNIVVQAKKSKSFNDAIETFTYNFLTYKFGREVNRCQIWYQFDEDALESV